MKNKPFIFNLFSLVFTIVALSFPVQIMLIYDHGFDEFTMILSKMTFLNHVTVVLLLLNTYLSFRGDPLLKLTLPVMIGVVVINNWIVSRYGADFDMSTTTLATILFTLFTSSILFSKGMDVIDDPLRRWWLIPKRYQKKLPVYIKTIRGGFFMAKTFDISSSGIFISLESCSKEMGNLLDSKIQPGQIVEIQIPTNSKVDFICDARVIRKTMGGGVYPGGLGVQFERVDLKNKFNLYRILKTNNFAMN